MNQQDIRTARFRIADYKKSLLEAYDCTVVLLSGKLEELIRQGNAGELASTLVELHNAIRMDVFKIAEVLDRCRIVTDEPGDSFENALDEAVREHCEGVRNE